MGLVLDKAGGSVTTTTADETDLLSIATSSDSSAHVMVVVTARSTTDGDAASYAYDLTVENTSGTLAIVGTGVNRAPDGEEPGWLGVTFGTSTNSLVVKVTGQASDTVVWNGYAELYQGS